MSKDPAILSELDKRRISIVAALELNTEQIIRGIRRSAFSNPHSILVLNNVEVF